LDFAVLKLISVFFAKTGGNMFHLSVGIQRENGRK